MNHTPATLHLTRSHKPDPEAQLRALRALLRAPRKETEPSGKAAPLSILSEGKDALPPSVQAH